MSRVGILKDAKETSSLALHVADWLAVIIAAFCAHRLYLNTWDTYPGYSLAIFLCMILTAWIFSLLGVYRSWRGQSFIDEIRLVLFGWFLVFMLLGALTVLTKSGNTYSRGWGLLWFCVGFVNLAAFRISIRLAVRRLRRSGYNHRKILVVGIESSVKEVVQSLKNAPWAGIDVVGVFYDETKPDPALAELKLGGLGSLAHYCGEHTVDTVWIALPLSEQNRLPEILEELKHTAIDISYVPDLFSVRLINHSLSTVANLPVINLTLSPMFGLNRIFKALEDRILSLFILLLTSPLLLVIMVAVKLTSRGPIFYGQERIGWNNKPFNMLKFRTMETNAEAAGVLWGCAREKQLTPIGGFLRKTSLDELPQFINVLKGDMSIVGPRPERTVFVEQFKEEIPGYMKKHLVKAGITGWAQINGWRGDTDLSKRIEYDLIYIENWSIWFDLKIILLTVFKGFVSKEAY